MGAWIFAGGLLLLVVGFALRMTFSRKADPRFEMLDRLFQCGYCETTILRPKRAA
jgi:hypothetical protein